MIIREIKELPGLLARNQCLLGLDYGSKVIGIAVSDPGLRVASPLASLVRTKLSADAAKLAGIVKERDIGGFVVGLPKHMDGSEGASAQAARAFMRNLSERGFIPSTAPVFFWDERLSTSAVERFLIQNDMSRRRRDEVVDKMAAAYILQGALDALRISTTADRFD